MDGDMHVMKPNGLAPLCLQKAFDNDERVNRFLRRYPKHIIMFDGVKLERRKKKICPENAGVPVDTPNRKERVGEDMEFPHTQD